MASIKFFGPRVPQFGPQLLMSLSQAISRFGKFFGLYSQSKTSASHHIIASHEKSPSQLSSRQTGRQRPKKAVGLSKHRTTSGLTGPLYTRALVQSCPVSFLVLCLILGV